MGADLTIKKLEDTARGGFEVSKEAVESGYFRDCYNSKGLFIHMGLSWWELTRKHKKWFNKEGDLTVDGARKLLKIVEKAAKGLKDKEYIDWANLLMVFLKKAISLKSEINWSV